MIRKAKICDIKQIHGILSQYAQQGQLLGRSLSELYDQIRDFFVCIEPESHRVIAVCGLHICWDAIAEIRSLAVVKEHWGKGLGKELVHACLQEAMLLEIRRLFVLTYLPQFFEGFGFARVDKSVLPHKVWSDCIKCVHFPDCDEEAMILDLNLCNRAG